MTDKVVNLFRKSDDFSTVIKYLQDEHAASPIKTLIFVGTNAEGGMVFGHSNQTGQELLFSATWLEQHIMSILRDQGVMPE